MALRAGEVEDIAEERCALYVREKGVTEASVHVSAFH